MFFMQRLRRHFDRAIRFRALRLRICANLWTWISEVRFDSFSIIVKSRLLPLRHRSFPTQFQVLLFFVF